jgi:hypothetical protein
MYTALSNMHVLPMIKNGTSLLKLLLIFTPTHYCPENEKEKLKDFGMPKLSFRLLQRAGFEQPTDARAGGRGLTAA